MVFLLAETVLKLQKAISTKNIVLLREISNYCADNLVLEPKTIVLNLALFSYALSKLSEKQHILKDKSWHSFTRLVEKKLGKCFESAKTGDVVSCERVLVELMDSVGVVESRDRRYVRSIIDKGRIKIASRLYAQGVSLGNAAEITGALKRDVAHYAGKTMMHDRAGITMNILERLKRVRKIFSRGEQ